MLPIIHKLEHLPETDVLNLYNKDDELIRLANEIRIGLVKRPSQSHFRVIAIFIVRHRDFSVDNSVNPHAKRVSFVCGSNAEQGYIGGAICAERATLTRLRFYEDVEVLKIVITTDSEHAISPGALCREYLMTAAMPTTTIIMGNASGNQVVQCTVKDLWPYPYSYRYCQRCDIISTAETVSSKAKPIIDLNYGPNAQAKQLFLDYPDLQERLIPTLISTANKFNTYDKAEGLHPLRFSAAVLYSNGETFGTWILKGLEYGCTVDPVSQLIRHLDPLEISSEADSKEAVTRKPLMICLTDQFGVLHAPFAAARSLLNEHGHGKLFVLLHDSEGEMVLVTAEELMPTTSSSVGSVITHDDFN